MYDTTSGANTRPDIVPAFRDAADSVVPWHEAERSPRELSPYPGPGMLPPVDELTVDYGPPALSLAPPRLPEVNSTGDIAPPRSGTRHKKPSASEHRLRKRKIIESEPSLSEKRSRRPRTPVPVKSTFRPDPRKTGRSVSLAVVAAVIGAALGTGLGHERLAELFRSSNEPPTTGEASFIKVARAAPQPSECTPPPAPAPTVERSEVPLMRFEDLPLAERDEKDPNAKTGVSAGRRLKARTGAKR